MPRFVIIAFLTLFGTQVVSAQVAAAAPVGSRVALIIGLNSYQNVAALNNPVPDAKAIAAALRSYDFDVFEYYDITRADLLDALEAFKERANKASLALVYYAGHGMEVGGKNILAPVDVEISCEPKKARRAVELEKLFEAVEGAPRQVVLLDACRNDPFPQCPSRAARAGSGFRSFSGLGAPDRALLIANATLSGQLAADGDAGEHSPFARALLHRFKNSPQAYLRDLLDLTAQDVRIASRGAQIPEITSRGGAPRICLSPTGCGEGGSGAQSALSDEAAIAEASRLLRQLGFASDATRGQGNDALAEAVKRFQTNAGLAPDGKITPALLAVLRATQRQVATLSPGTGGGGAPGTGVFSRPLEHEVGETFKDCELCPEMVVIPGGQFAMGASAGEGGQPSERPAHEVRIGRPLAVGKFEITFDEWEACTLEGGCNGYKPKDSGWGRGRRPVIYVSWDDAKAYVAWLRQRTGQPYRLLSEAEWEYATRGGTTTAYATGSGIKTAQANFDASSAVGARKRGSYEGKTMEVGSFPPSPFGLYDVHGNVAEWVEDCWNPSHAGAPNDGSARGGDCKRRVLKGGAWYYEPDYLRSAARLSYPKSVRLNIVGFRVARTLE